ncbi:MAG: DUF1559 domain-containing protein, partial [Planctomycetota bacterium]
AELVGGRASYLKSLAAVALTADPGPVRRRFGLSSSEPVAWPARAFLPSRRTLHERVEMLRRPPRSRSRWTAAAAGPLAGATVLAVAVIASGFRPAPASEPLSPMPGPVLFSPQETPANPPAEAAVAAAPDVLSYVPADAQLVGVLEAKTLMAHPAVAPILTMLRSEDGPEADLQETFGFGLDDVERVAMYVARLAPGPDGDPTLPTFVIRTVGEAPAPTVSVIDGKTVPPERAPVRKLDARTLLFSPGGLGKASKPAESFVDNPLMTAAAGENAAVSLYLNLDAIRPVMLEGLDAEATRGLADPGFQALAFGLARPLATNVDRVAGSLSLQKDGTVAMTVVGESPTEQAAETTKATLQAVLTMAGNALDAAPALAGGDPQQALGVAMVVGLARKALDSTTVAADGPRTTLTMEMDSSAPLLVGVLLPATQSAREAARRTQSMNNLKQIGLALFNYEATYGHFPPAVLVENGVPRSWRVEILPFIDQVDLYERYDKTKPWDHPANAAVLKEIPEVFRSPSDDRDGPFP